MTEKDRDRLDKWFEEAIKRHALGPLAKASVLMAKDAIHRLEDMDNTGTRGWADCQNAARGWISTAINASNAANTEETLALKEKLDKKLAAHEKAQRLFDKIK